MTNAKKPTAAMVEAGAKIVGQLWGSGLNDRERAVWLYTAMRALEPAAPVEDGEVWREEAKQILMSDLGPLTDAFDRLEHDDACEVVDRLGESIERIASRLASQPPAADALVERLRTVAKRVSRELRDHAENLSPRLNAYPADIMLREANRIDAALAKLQGGGE